MLDEVDDCFNPLYGPANQILKELKEALNSNKASDIYNVVNLLQSLQEREHPMYNYFSQISSSIKLLDDANEHLKEWRANLKKGDLFNWFSKDHGVG